MNLIEQLGGYEKVKDKAKELEYKLNNSEFLGGGSGREFMCERLYDIEFALLEYRRQHNIFEVGDKVVLINMSDKEIFEYAEYSRGLDLHFFESEYNYGHAKLSDIRHATNEEIKVGHRL
jgi:hypothetical protein